MRYSTHNHAQAESQHQEDEPLALFGHADHLDTTPQGPATWQEAVKNSGVLSGKWP